MSIFRASKQIRKETDEEYSKRLQLQKERQEKLRSKESSEERAARQKSDRIYQQQRRQTINKEVDEYFDQNLDQNGKRKYRDYVQARLLSVWKNNQRTQRKYRQSMNDDQRKKLRDSDAAHQRHKRLNETEEEKQKRLEDRRQWNWENCVEIQKQVRKYEHSAKGRAKIEERKEKLEIGKKAARSIDEAFLKEVIDSIIQDPEIGNEE